MRTNITWAQRHTVPKFHPKLVFSQIVLEQRSGIKKSFWGWFKPIHKDNRRLSSNQFWLLGILHPELNKHVKTKDMFVPFVSLRECPWKWPDPGACLTSEALSLSPCKPSWALLGQGVVVGVFFWSVKQHLSVGDIQRGRMRGVTQEVAALRGTVLSWCNDFNRSSTSMWL